MAWIEVDGGKMLFGRLKVQGSKNAVLPMLAASILTEEPVRIAGSPKIQDVYSMIELLRDLGCLVHWEEDCIVVEAALVESALVKEQCVKAMRSSISLLGPMLGRTREASIAYPGGCPIGERPIDLHVKALRKMNVEITEGERGIACKVRNLKGSTIELDFPSVGATENVITAAVLAKGTTILRNAAREPEIVCLCHFLKSMGAMISGAGSAEICIHGVQKLHGTTFRVMSDRIAAGTYMAAVAGTGGEVFLEMNAAGQLDAAIGILREAGAEIFVEKGGMRIRSSGGLRAVRRITTEPYPGFPTDLQSPFMAVLSAASGESVIEEKVFEKRFKTAAELVKMGASIEVRDKIAIVKGVRSLCGCPVTACDLRGGAALVIAGLMAGGTTRIKEIGYILRGYEELSRSFGQLGAGIRLMQEKGG